MVIPVLLFDASPSKMLRLELYSGCLLYIGYAAKLMQLKAIERLDVVEKNTKVKEVEHEYTSSTDAFPAVNYHI